MKSPDWGPGREAGAWVMGGKGRKKRRIQLMLPTQVQVKLCPSEGTLGPCSLDMGNTVHGGTHNSGISPFCCLQTPIPNNWCSETSPSGQIRCGQVACYKWNLVASSRRKKWIRKCCNPGCIVTGEASMLGSGNSLSRNRLQSPSCVGL